MPATPNETGAVKFYNPNRGFGFIAPHRGGNEIFFHLSALKENGVDECDMRPGTVVEFNTKRGRKGPRVFFITLNKQGKLKW